METFLYNDPIKNFLCENFYRGDGNLPIIRGRWGVRKLAAPTYEPPAPFIEMIPKILLNI